MHRSLIWLLGLLLMVSCEEDEYYYPSVKLEFVTVKAGNDGKIQMVIPDKEAQLQVSKDFTNSNISPNTSKRVLSNYEKEVVSAVGEAYAKIYSLQAVTLLEPKKLDDPAFGGVMKTDPVDVTSIWFGGGYLNMILNIMTKGGKQHILGIVEEGEVDAKGNVTLSLYHNANGDEEYYSRSAYVSVPISKYGLNKELKVKFRYHTCDENGGIIESVKYCTYVPDEN